MWRVFKQTLKVNAIQVEVQENTAVGMLGEDFYASGTEVYFTQRIPGFQGVHISCNRMAGLKF